MKQSDDDETWFTRFGGDLMHRAWGWNKAKDMLERSRLCSYPTAEWYGQDNVAKKVWQWYVLESIGNYPMEMFLVRRGIPVKRRYVYTGETSAMHLVKVHCYNIRKCRDYQPPHRAGD